MAHNMAQTFTGRKRIRKFFGHIREVAEMPNLIEVQKASYDQFLLVNEPEGGRPDEGDVYKRQARHRVDAYLRAHHRRDASPAEGRVGIGTKRPGQGAGPRNWRRRARDRAIRGSSPQALRQVPSAKDVYKRQSCCWPPDSS